MTIAKTKTWQRAYNIALPTTGTALDDWRQFWYTFKERLKSFGTFPFAVSGSSNGTAAGLDGVDRLAAYADWSLTTSATAARGWIVLKCPVLGFQILISGHIASTTTTSGVRFKVSPGGLYTGGTTTADPTATDEIVLCDGASTVQWGRANATGGRAMALHLRRSSDGQVTQWAACTDTYAKSVGYLGALEDPTNANLRFFSLWGQSTANWTIPLGVSHCFDEATATANNDTHAGIHRSHLSGLPVNARAAAYLVAPSVNVSGNYATTTVARCATFENYATHAASPNQILATHTHPKIPVYCNTTGDRGIHGTLFDMRWAGDEAAHGDTYPADGTRTWVKMGPFAMDWDGTLPLMA